MGKRREPLDRRPIKRSSCENMTGYVAKVQVLGCFLRHLLSTLVSLVPGLTALSPKFQS